MKIMRIFYCLFTYLFSLDYLVFKLELQLFLSNFMLKLCCVLNEQKSLDKIVCFQS